MDLLRSLIQDLENGKQSAYQMRSLLQQLQGSDGAAQLDHDHQYYYKGFSDHSMVILSTFDNALSKVQRCDLFKEAAIVENNDYSISTPTGCKSQGLTPKSCTSKNRRGCHRRRKIGQSATVIVVPNLADDGNAWRKYGQKSILNDKYPRNYYRCTHKFDQGCQATKQVQQISAKPDEYRVIYQGDHTCKTLFTKTSRFISDDHEHQDSSFYLRSSNPTQAKHAPNSLIFSSLPLSSSSTPSPSLSPSPSSSSSPFTMVKQECYAPIKDGNQSGPSDLHQSSDQTSTSIAASDKGDVISSSIDVQGSYPSGVAYHGADNEEYYRNMLADFTVFDDVMMQDILCV